MKTFRLFAISIILMLCGCASTVILPSDSGNISPHPAFDQNHNRQLLGIWDMQIDISNLTASIKPLRQSESRYNITGLLLPPACNDCVTVKLLDIDFDVHILTATLELRNPTQLTAYDARCIVYTDNYGHRLINDDGWSGLWDRAGGSDINPFKAFAKEDIQRAFNGGASYTEMFYIHFPSPPNYWAITYAIDVSWPENTLEPYEITNYSQEIIYNTPGSTGNIFIDIHDWQDDVDFVTLEAPQITGEESNIFTHLGGNTWTVEIENANGVPGGLYECMVGASSYGVQHTLYDFVNIVITNHLPDLDALFAPPTHDELAMVISEWESRDVSVHNYQLEGQAENPDGSQLMVVSHTVEGERHYGAIRIPPGTHQPGSLPVLVITHGGSDGTSNLAFHQNSFIGDNFIQVLPSFRGEPLIIYGGPLEGTYNSEGESNGYDTDADDTIALLNLCLEHVLEADESRMAVMGGSRGGGTALRVKVRDNRILGAIDIAGATDFFSDQTHAAALKHINDPSFLGNNPIEQGIIAKIIDPLLSGELDIPTARHMMLLASPRYFAEYMPRVQVYHGALDEVVPVEQSDNLAKQMANLGISTPEFEYFRYENGTHDPSTFPGYFTRVEFFLTWILNPD